MSRPAVSVIVPAFNRRDSIVDAVRSVLRQTFRDIEVLVVDDGSTDDTIAALGAVDDPRVRLLAHTTNRGVSAARNTGLREAAADWIAFQDSDDEWLPAKLEKQMTRLAGFGSGAVACYCGMAIVEQCNDRASLRYVPPSSLKVVEGDILPALLETSFVSTQTLVVRGDALRAVGGFDEALPALVDWECMLRLTARGPIAFVDEPLVVQRFSGNSLTRDRRRRAEARRMIVEKHERLIGADRIRLAHHHRAIAGEYRRVGDYATGLGYALKALRLDPLSPIALAALLWLVALRLTIGPLSAEAAPR